MYDFLIVGAGLYGAVCARELTDRGYKCLVIDRRAHIAGNIYTEEVEGIQVHKYGAHIFHTSDKEVWQYVNRFAHKGTALSDLQVRLIIEKYDTACLGDSDNDIPMMHGAKYAVCIGTRSESLRKACNRHAAPAAEALHTLLEI